MLKYFLCRATSSVQSACGVVARYQWESCLGGDVRLTGGQQSRLRTTELLEHKQQHSIHHGSAVAHIAIWEAYVLITSILMALCQNIKIILVVN